MERGKGLKKVSFRGGGFFTCCALLLWSSSLLVSSSERALAALSLHRFAVSQTSAGREEGLSERERRRTSSARENFRAFEQKKSPEGGGLVTVRTKRSSLHLLRTRPRRYCLSPLLSSPPPSLNRESLPPPFSFSYSIPPFLEALQRTEATLPLQTDPAPASARRLLKRGGGGPGPPPRKNRSDAKRESSLIGVRSVAPPKTFGKQVSSIDKSGSELGAGTGILNFNDSVSQVFFFV